MGRREGKYRNGGEGQITVPTMNADDVGNGNTRKITAGRLRRVKLDIAIIQAGNRIQDMEWA